MSIIFEFRFADAKSKTFAQHLIITLVKMIKNIILVLFINNYTSSTKKKLKRNEF